MEPSAVALASRPSSRLGAAATTAGEHGVAASAHAVQLRNKRCQRARRRRGSSPAQLREAPAGEPAGPLSAYLDPEVLSECMALIDAVE